MVRLDDTREIDSLSDQLIRLRTSLLAQEATFEPMLAALPAGTRPSARNLIHYMTLRRLDRRRLQEQLAQYGLSSLGRAEAYVMANLDAVLRLLHLATHRVWNASDAGVTLDEGRRLLHKHSQTLLGSAPAGRTVRIMVTMPGEAAGDYSLVRALLANGMNVMRINCAHDDRAAWEQMLAHLQRAMRETGLSCKVLMDLAGPKPRTGPVRDGPQVAKWRPRRNVLGVVTRPARVWLTPIDAPQPAPQPADASLPLPREFLAALAVGDELVFVDARASRRSLSVAEPCAGSWWAEATQTAYVVPGTELSVRRAPANRLVGSVGALPPVAQTLLLRKGEMLRLLREPTTGQPEVRSEQGQLLAPGRIGCTLPQVLDHVKAGEQIWFDDGKIGGVIRALDAEGVDIEIMHARPAGGKLGAFKGINLPGTRLRLSALTEQDLADLPFVVQHADMVGYSFVRTAEDVRALQDELAKLGGEQLGLILKIESRSSFEELPNLLLAVMRSRAAGVMIARGDLAVECGFERLAEVQEEILWLCEAAHMPVIWATQVLESLTRDGMPSRAEVTDAAMAERAECVMLNKGRYAVEAVRTLDDILKRMDAHQSKKRSMLRQLRLAETFFDGHAARPH